MPQPIKEAIENTVTQIGTHTFVFGNLFEANLDLDKLEPASFPVAVFVPPLEYEDSWSESAALNNTTALRILFLDRVPNEVDPTAEQQNEIIETQLLASRQFWQTLAKDELIRELGNVINNAIFDEEDASLYGVSAEVEAELYLDQPGCVNP